MKNKFILFLTLILVLGFGIFIFMGSGNGKIIDNVLGSNGQVQVVKLSTEGSRYILNPSEIKKGVTVRLEADMSKMPGCSKSIVIPAFNVRGSFTSEDNIIEFTPDKAGTFNIACSMNMYRGTFTVLEDNGAKASYVEQASASTTGGTCGGASGGGCGCGG